MLTDQEIMVCVQAEETGLFAELVSRYQAKLLRFAISKVHQFSIAEELVQETFLAAYQARMTYSSDFAFSTWIWTILLNLSRTVHRKQVRQTESLRRYAEQFPIAHYSHRAESTDPHAALVVQEHHRLLHHQLSQLPEPQADAIRLRFFGDLSYEEIALTMNSSISGAKRRVRKGLTKLAELIETP